VKLKDGSIFPTSPAGNAVADLPTEVASAWREARTAHAVAAYTAAELMCRKILMHVAADKTGSKEGEPFTVYIDDLDKAGYIATGLKPVVDQVRQRGAAATHKLRPSTEDESRVTLGVTEYLLEGIYQLPGMAKTGATVIP